MAFPTGWGRKCKLTVQSSKVPGNLTNFPVLLTAATLPSEMFDADGSYPALSGGGDIRFSSDADGSTQLACEIVTLTINNDPALGKAEIHVKDPSLSGSSNTDLYVWYNKTGESQPSETDTYGKHNVWDSNYQLVMHMNDETTSTLLDSTSNSHDATKKAANEPVEATGIIGKGQSFDGTNDYVATANASDNLDITTTITIEAIIKPSELINSSNADYITIVSRQQEPNGSVDSYTLALNPSGKLHFGTYGGNIQGTQVSWSSGTVYHVAGTYNSTGLTGALYVDGVAEVLTSDNYDTMAGGANALSIGANDYTALGQCFQGIIDELRISNIIRSANWIETNYNNQNDPATFIIAGTPETPSGGVSGNPWNYYAQQ